ncbi:multidrug ABC transporter ATPase [Microbacterium sp.]|uniref:multidrug ABC transporter ATPase n=1 Tax=Microbacterium sp. TaxID=51671 RepID=UPI0039E5F0A6
MSTPTPEPEIRRVDRALAFCALALIAASIAGFVSIMVGTANGMDAAAFGEGAWPFIASILYWGPPLAFILIITLLIMSFVRKGRAARR